MGHGQWGHRWYGANGVWATWAMGTGGMGHMGNGAYDTVRHRWYGVWATWPMGIGGMGHMGNGNTWGSRVQGYGVQWVSATWAMGQVGYRGYAVERYG